jgi:hypothetical protein
MMSTKNYLCTCTAALLSMSLLPACAAGGGDTGDDTPDVPGARAPVVTGADPAPGHMTPMPGTPMPGTSAPAEKGGNSGPGFGGYNFTYHGGALIQDVKVVTVFWGSGVDEQSSLDQFYTAIVQSPYVDWLSEYDAGQQSIGRGTFETSFVDTGAPAGGQVADQAIQHELSRLLGAGALPAADANTLYMVHFPPGVSITTQGIYSCQQFCAYHSSFQSGSAAAVYYGVIPDMGGACASCGGGGDKLSSTTVITSHELVESITDPGIGIANQTQNAALLGWYDDASQNGEIADVCQGQNGAVNGWAVQQVYSMQAGGCITTRSGAGGGDAGSGGAAGCAHGVCLTGAPLLSTCGPCTAKVAQADPHCASGTWDAACVNDATTICGKRCQ